MPSRRIELALQWCNGRHYFPLAAPFCPGSGYSNGRSAVRLRALVRGHASYSALVRAGAVETDLLRLVLATTGDHAERLTSTCGAEVPLEVGAAVDERNRELLLLFPGGELSAAMSASPASVAYARLPGDRFWTLVDRQFLGRWQTTERHDIGVAGTDDVLASLASRLGVGRAAVKAGSEGRDATPLEIRHLLVPREHPPLLINDDLYEADRQTAEFIAARFPSVPIDHLNFLPRFYPAADPSWRAPA